MKVIKEIVEVKNKTALRNIVAGQKKYHKSGVFCAAAEVHGKYVICIAVSSDLVGQYNAVSIAKKMGKILKGFGCGRPDLGLVEGTVENFEKAFEVI